MDKLDSLDVLIAGAVYIIDLKNKIQYQKNRNWRRREIKRDVVTASRKGVAGMHDAGKGDDVTTTAGTTSTATDGVAGTSSAPQTPGSQTAVQMALGHISSQTPNVPSTSANVAPPPTARNGPLGGSNNAPSSLPSVATPGHHHSYNTRSSS